MKLFLGLGNPGKDYLNTRHNLGQQVINRLIKQEDLALKHHPRLQCQTALLGPNRQALLATTTTFMNNSGLAVKKLMGYYKIYPEDLYLIHDDLDLGVGEWKLQFDRGPAGHNGVSSVIQQLGTRQFHRFRLGIGHPAIPIPVEDYVLQTIPVNQRDIIDQVISEITAKIIDILKT